jgi:hypothetical protein
MTGLNPQKLGARAPGFKTMLKATVIPEINKDSKRIRLVLRAMRHAGALRGCVLLASAKIGWSNSIFLSQEAHTSS